MNRNFCICLSKSWGPFAESLELAAETGWNGYFTVWRPDLIFTTAM